MVLTSLEGEHTEPQWTWSLQACHGNLPPGQNKDLEKHCQKLRVSTSCFKGFCSNLELLCFDSNPAFLSSSHWAECGQKELTEDTGLFFTPCEGRLRERRKELYFFLPSFDRQWKESGHQEAFLEEKYALAWVSALSYLMTISKANTLSPSMHHFLWPISFPVWLPFPSYWYTR